MYMEDFSLGMEFDISDVVIDKQQMMEDFAAKDGWTLLTRFGQMQVFCNTAEEPTPIETDPVTKVETIYRAMKKNLLPAHLERICADYHLQMNAMLEGMARLPEGTTYTVPQGGLFVWAQLPEHVDALALLQKCIEKYVAFVLGTHFYPDGGHENTLRLNFSMQSVENIALGMQNLGEALKSK